MVKKDNFSAMVACLKLLLKDKYRYGDSIFPGGGEINNEDITITENGVYTAGEGYTGIGTATVDVPEGNIVTATNTTGSAISSGDKVWLNKVSGGWNIVPFYATDLGFKYLNYRDITFVGAPIVDYTLVASNISASNYFESPTLTNFDPNHCTVYFRFSTTSTTNGQGIFFGSISAQINNSGKFCLWNDRTSVFESFFSVSTNTEYWTKVVINGAERTVYYKTSASADYTLAGSYTNVEVGTSFQVIIGRSPYSSYLRGKFFFSSFEIHDENDNTVWTAYKYDINTTDKSLSGIAQENIAVNGSGGVKTVLPEQVSV